MQNVSHYAALLWARRESIMLTAAAVLVVLRATLLTDARWAVIEARWPRVAASLRLARALAPDLWKAAKLLYPLLTGRAWPGPAELPKLRDTDPAPPRGQAGSAGLSTLAFVVLSTALVLGLARCSSSQVHQQAVAATALAGAANRAQPILLAAYRSEELGAVQRGRAAVLEVRSRWAGVWVALEAARLAHDRWAGVLMVCQSDPHDARCTTLPTAEAAALDGLLGYRCAVRALGRPELDPLPASMPASCDAADGGSDV